MFLYTVQCGFRVFDFQILEFLIMNFLLSVTCWWTFSHRPKLPYSLPFPLPWGLEPTLPNLNWQYFCWVSHLAQIPDEDWTSFGRIHFSWLLSLDSFKDVLSVWRPSKVSWWLQGLAQSFSLLLRIMWVLPVTHLSSLEKPKAESV